MEKDEKTLSPTYSRKNALINPSKTNHNSSRFKLNSTSSHRRNTSISIVPNQNKTLEDFKINSIEPSSNDAKGKEEMTVDAQVAELPNLIKNGGEKQKIISALNKVNFWLNEDPKNNSGWVEKGTLAVLDET